MISFDAALRAAPSPQFQCCLQDVVLFRAGWISGTPTRLDEILHRQNQSRSDDVSNTHATLKLGGGGERLLNLKLLSFRKS